MWGFVLLLFCRLLVQALFLILQLKYLFRETLEVPVELILYDRGEFFLALKTAQYLFSWLEKTYRESVTFWAADLSSGPWMPERAWLI
jgi:hypothetical protein